jgi:hypothetical protein
MSLESDALEVADRIGGGLVVILNAQWKSGRFIINGHGVAIETIRNSLTRIESTISTMIGKLVDDLEAQTITVDEWTAETKKLIASSHVLSAALACGSIRTAAYDPRVTTRIYAEFQYFDKFAAQVKRDIQPN